LLNGRHQLSQYRFVQDEQMRWLKRFIADEPNGIDRELPITVCWEVIEPEDKAGAVPRWVTRYKKWPPPEVIWQRFRLTGSGLLELDATVQESFSERRYVYPVGTEALCGYGMSSAPCSSGVLHYWSAPFERPLVILGSPEIVYSFCCGTGDLDVMIVLRDVDPSGNAVLVQRTVARASARQQLATRSRGELVEPGRVRSQLNQGEVCQLRVSLGAVGHAVRTGHRILLSIMAPTNLASPVWGFAPLSQPTMVTVYHGGDHESWLGLPTLDGYAQLPAAATVGELRNQPYRIESAR